jgi:peptidoglycan hydrolase-like protein with peptidoglycan-binding domain
MAIAFSQSVLLTLLAIASHNTISALPEITTSRDSNFTLTAVYTDKKLPTLRRGNKGKDVQKLQQILLDNGFLGAASARLETGVKGVAIDGIFGSTTESAVRDLQLRYKLQVNGIVTTTTWKTLDAYENPYHSPLPWKVTNH